MKLLLLLALAGNLGAVAILGNQNWIRLQPRLRRAQTSSTDCSGLLPPHCRRSASGSLVDATPLAALQRYDIASPEPYYSGT